MKDIVIPGRSIRRELLILLGCLAGAIALNIYAILHYGRPFRELFTQIGFTVAFTLGIYAALWLVRLLVLLVYKLAGWRRGGIDK